LSGGKHRDVMIGGLGVDSLRGDQGDDILIGGTTDHDTNRVALDQIMATWSHPKDSFSTRIGKLSPLLNGTTVNDDGSRDRLEGGTQRDWYLDYLLADTIVGFSSSQDKKN
jgi:Ca2+-binding RTX toxin-like protein